MKIGISQLARFGAVVALSAASVFASAVVASAAPLARASATSTVVVQGSITALTPTPLSPTSMTIQPFDLSRPTENIPFSPTMVVVKAGAPVAVTALTVGTPVRVTLSGTPALATTVQIMLPHPIVVSGAVTTLIPANGTPTSFVIQPRDSSAVTTSVALNAGTVIYVGTHVASLAALTVGSQVRVLASGSPLTANVVYVAVVRPVTVSGVVTALSPSSGPATSFTLQPEDHRHLALTVMIGANTTVRQGGAIVTVANLLVGSHVRVTMSGVPALATSILIAVPRPVTVVGTVTSLTPASGTPTAMMVQPRGVWKAPVTIALSAATTYRQLRNAATLGDLLVGSRVIVSATGSPLTATIVHIVAPAAAFTVGSVPAVTSTSLVVQPATSGSTPVTFQLTGSTMYFSGRRMANLAAVNVGDVVRVGANAASPTAALIVTVRNMVIVGRVSAVQGDVISVTGFYGTALTVNVTSSTQYRVAGHSANLSAITPGVMISAIGPAMSGVTTSVSASTVWIGVRHNDIFQDELVQHREFAERHHR